MSGAETLEAILQTRTKVPLDRLDDFLTWPDAKLSREKDIVSRVLRKFARAVIDSMDDPGSIQAFATKLDLRTISRDHNWRAVFSALRAGQAGDENNQRSVLIKYLQYLSFRKRLLEFIYVKRQGLEKREELLELTAYPGPAVAEWAGLEAYRLSRLSESERKESLTRVEVGETVALNVPEGGKVDVILAGHRFHLFGGRPPSFVDQNGLASHVAPGRNLVGRHPESDIRIARDFSEVSRAHMVLEWDGLDEVLITDLSSRGTFLRGSEVGELPIV